MKFMHAIYDAWGNAKDEWNTSFKGLNHMKRNSIVFIGLIGAVLGCPLIALSQGSVDKLYEQVSAGEYEAALRKIDRDLERIEGSGGLGSEDWGALFCLRVEALIKLDSLAMADSLLDLARDIEQVPGWWGIRQLHLRLWNNSLRGMWQLVVLLCEGIMESVPFYEENARFSAMVDSYYGLGLWHMGELEKSWSVYMNLRGQSEDSRIEDWDWEIFLNFWKLARNFQDFDTEKSCFSIAAEIVEGENGDAFFKVALDYQILRQLLDFDAAGDTFDREYFEIVRDRIKNGSHEQYKYATYWLCNRVDSWRVAEFLQLDFRPTNCNGLALLQEAWEDEMRVHLDMLLFDRVVTSAEILLELNDQVGNVAGAERAIYFQIRGLFGNSSRKSEFQEWLENWSGTSPFLSFSELGELHRLRLGEFNNEERDYSFEGDSVRSLFVNYVCGCFSGDCREECNRCRFDSLSYRLLLADSTDPAGQCDELGLILGSQQNSKYRAGELVLWSILGCSMSPQKLAETLFQGGEINGVRLADLSLGDLAPLGFFLLADLRDREAWEDMFLVSLRLSKEFAHLQNGEAFLMTQVALIEAAGHLGYCEIVKETIAEFENLQAVGEFELDFPSAIPEFRVCRIFADALSACWRLDDDMDAFAGADSLYEAVLRYHQSKGDTLAAANVLNAILVHRWYSLENDERIRLLIDLRAMAGSYDWDTGSSLNLLAACVESGDFERVSILLDSLVAQNENSVHGIGATPMSDFYRVIELLKVQQDLMQYLRAAVELRHEEALNRIADILRAQRRMYHSIRSFPSDSIARDYADLFWKYLDHSLVVKKNYGKDYRMDFREKLRLIAENSALQQDGVWGVDGGRLEVIFVPALRQLEAGNLVTWEDGQGDWKWKWLDYNSSEWILASWDRALSSSTDWEIFGPVIVDELFGGFNFDGVYELKVLHGGGMNEIQFDLLLQDFMFESDGAVSYSFDGRLNRVIDEDCDWSFGGMFGWDYSTDKGRSRAGHLADLPFVKEEFDLLYDLSVSEDLQFRSWIGNSSSSEMIEVLEQSRLVHIGAHGGGIDDDQGRDESALSFVTNDLVLYSQSGFWFTTSDSTFFFPYEKLAVLDMSGCELVVVSSCHSGSSRYVSGVGDAGVASALARAGARNVVVSQWEVSDAASLEFVTGLYESLLSGDDVETSFSSARKRLRDQSYPPREWMNWRLIRN